MAQEVKLVVVNFHADNEHDKIEEFNDMINDMLSVGWNFLYKPKTTGTATSHTARFCITAWMVRNKS